MAINQLNFRNFKKWYSKKSNAIVTLYENRGDV